MRFHSVWFVVLIFFGWLGGFLWFVQDLERIEPKDLRKTGALVVLTGGKYRIADGFGLLDKGLADYMLISGVRPGTKLQELVPKDLQNHDFSTRVFLDYQSRTTRENAVNSIKWLKERNLTSMRLITANYHMRRSLLEFKNLKSPIEIHRHPLEMKDVQEKQWLEDENLLWLYVKEYNKYLGAMTRVYVKNYVSKVS